MTNVTSRVRAKRMVQNAGRWAKAFPARLPGRSPIGFQVLLFAICALEAVKNVLIGGAFGRSGGRVLAFAAVVIGFTALLSVRAAREQNSASPSTVDDAVRATVTAGQQGMAWARCFLALVVMLIVMRYAGIARADMTSAYLPLLFRGCVAVTGMAAGWVLFWAVADARAQGGLLSLPALRLSPRPQ